MIELEGMFEPEAVLRAAGISRNVFNSWLARRHLDVRSRGAGRVRKFTFDQVVRIAVTNELTRKFWIRIQSASYWTDQVRLPIADAGDFLLVADLSTAIAVHLDPGDSIDHVVAAAGLTPEQRFSWIMVDISRIAARVRHVLLNPDEPGPSYDEGHGMDGSV
jgi:hypothetical protein